MGKLLSKCKNKKQAKMIRVIYEPYTETTKTNSSSYDHAYQFSSNQCMPKQSSTSTDFNDNRMFTYRPTNLNRTEPLNRMNTQTETETFQQSLSTSSLIPVPSYGTENEDEEHISEEQKRIEHATSIPIDLFLVDISNEQVRIGESISMNILHLLLSMPEDSHPKTSVPICTETSSKAIYIKDNILDYIPDICERYPNETVSPDRPTHNALHASLSV